MQRLGLVLAGFLSASCVAPAQAAHRWYVYGNPYQQYQGCYAADLFQAQVHDPAQDQLFGGWDGSQLSMSGRYNDQALTLGQQMLLTEQAVLGERAPAFHILRGSYFEFSGVALGQVVFVKTILAGNAFKTFYVRYPVQDRPQFAPVVGHMASCFVSTD
jgi:hypothetical protein